VTAANSSEIQKHTCSSNPFWLVLRIEMSWSNYQAEKGKHENCGDFQATEEDSSSCASMKY
jgi:hypothetical protein